MEVEVSAKTKKIAKQFRLGADELAFADLCAVGWEPEDAWAVAIRKGITWRKAQLKEEISQLRNNPAVIERIDATKAVLRVGQVERIKNATNNERQNTIQKAMSKEQMLFDLQTALSGMLVGSKEWLDTKKLIIEVTRMKQDDVKEEENTIHHFLPVDYPVSCEFCLRNPENKKGGL